ncbi:MAG: Peptidoglycan-binding lysin protein [Gemmatimonadetes bacterium]|nr:Peptidoglycan-binding lysin protein [Gemmatimonadota bacterium]
MDPEASVEQSFHRPIPRRRRRARGVGGPRRYVLLTVILVLGIVIAQLLLHTVRKSPRDSVAIAERELRMNALQPGEKVFRAVPVFQRSAIDYFRATRGLLVLTDRRLLYLGLQPRDLTGSTDVPPVFEQRDFPIDTLVQLTRGRTFFMLSRALEVHAPDEDLTLGVASDDWSKGDLLALSYEGRHQKLLAEGLRQKQVRAAAASAESAALAESKQPRFHVVQRGEAMSMIATRYNTTAERIRALNQLPNDKIRVGQKLMVKPEG